MAIKLCEGAIGAAGVTMSFFPAIGWGIAIAIGTYLAYEGMCHLSEQINHENNEAAVREEEEFGKRPKYCGKALGNDPTKPPAEGFEWKGKGSPETGKGNWVKGDREAGTLESLHPDFDHPPPVKPHWDYEGPDVPKEKDGARLNLDGTWEWK